MKPCVEQQTGATQALDPWLPKEEDWERVRTATPGLADRGEGAVVDLPQGQMARQVKDLPVATAWLLRMAILRLEEEVEEVLPPEGTPEAVGGTAVPAPRIPSPVRRWCMRAGEAEAAEGKKPRPVWVEPVGEAMAARTLPKLAKMAKPTREEVVEEVDLPTVLVEVEGWAVPESWWFGTR